MAAGSLVAARRPGHSGSGWVRVCVKLTGAMQRKRQSRRDSGPRGVPRGPPETSALLPTWDSGLAVRALRDDEMSCRAPGVFMKSPKGRAAGV